MFAAGRAYEQIRNSIAYPKRNVKICATHAGISVGEDGASHQCIEDIALMRVIPEMKVFQPCDEASTKAIITAIADIEGPCYVRLGRCAVESVYQDYKMCIRDRHLVEGRNTGIPTALKAIRSNGSPLPIFLTDDERSFFSVILPIHSVFKETKVSSTHNINRKRTREELREDILLILKKDNKTAIEIYKDLGYTGSTSKTFRECLNQLIEEDRVCRIKEMNPPYRYLFQLKNKIVKQ